MSDKDLNIESLISKAKEMQDRMQLAQNQLKNMEIIGEAGGGEVRIKLSGSYDAKQVILSPAVLQEKKEILEALIAAAFNDAVQKVDKLSKDKLSVLAKDIGLLSDEQ